MESVLLKMEAVLDRTGQSGIHNHSGDPQMIGNSR